MINLAGVSTGLVVLASGPDGPGGQQGGQGQEFGSASPIALVVLILFFVAVGFLVRSMNKHLKRIPASFDNGDQHGGGAQGKQRSESSAHSARSATDQAVRKGDAPGDSQRRSGR